MMVTLRIWKYPDSYVEINGKRLPPGTYSVKKGDIIKVHTNVKNHGGTGSGWIGVRDKKIEGNWTQQVAWWSPYYNWKTGEVKFYETTLQVDRDMELYIVAGALDSSGRIEQDSYGAWIINVEDEGEVQPPSSEEQQGGLLGIPWYVWLILILLVGFLYFRSRRVEE